MGRNQCTQRRATHGENKQTPLRKAADLSRLAVRPLSNCAALLCCKWHSTFGDMHKLSEINQLAQTKILFLTCQFEQKLISREAAENTKKMSCSVVGRKGATESKLPRVQLMHYGREINKLQTFLTDQIITEKYPNTLQMEAIQCPDLRLQKSHEAGPLAAEKHCWDILTA